VIVHAGDRVSGLAPGNATGIPLATFSHAHLTTIGYALMTTIFDRILSGEIPCHRVYEDEHVLAFLDVGPLSPGHTLVIPKERAAKLHELSDESAAALGRLLPRLCRAVVAATGVEDYNVLQNNGMAAHQAVFHVHFHIIPKPEAGGLGISWPAGRLDASSAKSMQARIRGALQGEG
jgi:histidine triad (HIT) family protein